MLYILMRHQGVFSVTCSKGEMSQLGEGGRGAFAFAR